MYTVIPPSQTRRCLDNLFQDQYSYMTEAHLHILACLTAKAMFIHSHKAKLENLESSFEILLTLCYPATQVLSILLFKSLKLVLSSLKLMYYLCSASNNFP